MGKQRKKSWNLPFNPIETVPFTDDTYDFVASFAVSDPTTNYDVDVNQSAAFSNIEVARCMILWTDQDITVRLNSTSNPAIAVSAGDSPIEIRDMIQITNIYITTTGITANIKIFLA